MPAVLEIPRVARAFVRALEIPHEDLPNRRSYQREGVRAMFEWRRPVLAPFLTHVKKGDFNKGKVADLEETKRCIVLESTDGVRSMDQGNMLRKY